MPRICCAPCALLAPTLSSAAFVMRAITPTATTAVSRRCAFLRNPAFVVDISLILSRRRGGGRVCLPPRSEVLLAARPGEGNGDREGRALAAVVRRVGHVGRIGERELGGALSVHDIREAVLVGEGHTRRGVAGCALVRGDGAV